MSDGYGHPDGLTGGWGDNTYGWGDPYVVSGASVADPADGLAPDDGGLVVELVGVFGDGPYAVEVGGTSCSSVVPGDGTDCYPVRSGSRLRFALPPLAPGTYDIELSSAGGQETLLGAIEVLYRSRQAEVYALRSLMPPARNVGPRRPQDEELLV